MISPDLFELRQETGERQPTLFPFAQHFAVISDSLLGRQSHFDNTIPQIAAIIEVNRNVAWIKDDGGGHHRPCPWPAPRFINPSNGQSATSVWITGTQTLADIENRNALGATVVNGLHDAITRLRFEGTMEPDFWVPPLVGSWAVKRKLRLTAEEIGNLVEYLYATNTRLDQLPATGRQL